MTTLQPVWLILLCIAKNAKTLILQLKTVATNASLQLREMAERRISEDTPQAERANMIKFMDTLQRAYPSFRGMRTKDCIQLIEGFEHYRVSVNNPKKILFGTFECWEPLLDAISEETTRFQRDRKAL